MKKSDTAISFRCPVEIDVQLKKIQKATGMSFAEVTKLANSIYNKHLLRNGGRAVPPITPSAMKPEEKYLGRFTPEETMEDTNDTRPLF